MHNMQTFKVKLEPPTNVGTKKHAVSLFNLILKCLENEKFTKTFIRKFVDDFT